MIDQYTFIVDLKNVNRYMYQTFFGVIQKEQKYRQDYIWRIHTQIFPGFFSSCIDRYCIDKYALMMMIAIVKK